MFYKKHFFTFKMIEKDITYLIKTVFQNYIEIREIKKLVAIVGLQIDTLDCRTSKNMSHKCIDIKIYRQKKQYKMS